MFNFGHWEKNVSAGTPNTSLWTNRFYPGTFEATGATSSSVAKVMSAAVPESKTPPKKKIHWSSVEINVFS